MKTEADLERETRLAQCLAADQLQHQVEQLQTLWDATNDPKYLRQQTRSILALARLGTLPGAIDSLTPDSVGWAPPTSPTPDFRSPTSSSSLRTPQSALRTFSPPPSEDCSPESFPPPLTPSPPLPLVSPTPSAAEPCTDQLDCHPDHLAGLQIIEQRLLTLIETTAPTDTERLQSLQKTLADIRQEKAAVKLRISPNIVGATLNMSAQSAPTAICPTSESLDLAHQPLTMSSIT